MVAEGVGELVLDGNCLRLARGDGHGYTILWPAGFTPHVDQGMVQVRNGAGRTIAKVGDRIAGGGGYSSSGYGDCPGGTFGIHSIKVLPNVEVYFPKQDGTLGTDLEMERFVGKLVLERRCLKIADAIRVSDRVIMGGGQVPADLARQFRAQSGRRSCRNNRCNWPGCRARGRRGSIRGRFRLLSRGPGPRRHAGDITGLLGRLLGGRRRLCGRAGFRVALIGA